MSVVSKQLGQVRPATGGAAEVLYYPGSGVETRISHIIIVNTSGSAATFNIYHDDDGTTYTEATALVWEENLDANTMIAKALNLHMNNSSGRLAVESDTNLALTFTAYGTETT